MTELEPKILSVQTNAPKPSDRPHLAFLDGIRGITALYVMLGHTLNNLTNPEAMSPVVKLLRTALSFPHSAVGIFIVLSGFCLMLPVSKSGGLRGGVHEFIKRRARRLLPPYYVAFLISILVFFAFPHHTTTVPTSTVAKPFAALAEEGSTSHVSSAAKIVSHLLLVHNLNDGTAGTIDSPLWSVATEWQIYFIFALVLLPLSKRIGFLPLVPLGIIVGVLPCVLIRGPWDQKAACFWMIGLFAMGMAAADAWVKGRVTFSGRNLSRGSIGVLCCVFAAAFVGQAIYCGDDMFRGHWLWIGDTLVGLCSSFFILWCAFVPATGGNFTWPLRFLEHRYTVALGLFSYSLYLIHRPIQIRIYEALHARLSLSEDQEFWFMIFVAAPLLIGIAFVFHVMVERPFLNTRVRNPAGSLPVK